MLAHFVDFALERVNVTRMVFKKNSFHALIVGIAVSLSNKTWNPKTEPFVAKMLNLVMLLHDFCFTL